MSTKIKIVYTIWDVSGYSRTSQRNVQLTDQEEKEYHHAWETFWPLSSYGTLKRLLIEVKTDIENDEKKRREIIGNADEFSVMVEFVDHPEKAKITENEARMIISDLFLQSDGDYYRVQNYVELSWLKYKDGDLEDLSLRIANELGYQDYEGLDEGVGPDNPKYLEWLSEQGEDKANSRVKYRYG